MTLARNGLAIALLAACMHPRAEDANGRAVFHNLSPLRAMLAERGTDGAATGKTGCLQPGIASQPASLDVSRALIVVSCDGLDTYALAKSGELPSQAADVYFKTSFVARNLAASNGTLIVLFNETAQSRLHYVVASEGAAPLSICLASNQRRAVAVSPGIVTVTADFPSACAPQAAQPGLPYSAYPVSLTVARGTMQEIGVRAWLDNAP